MNKELIIVICSLLERFLYNQARIAGNKDGCDIEIIRQLIKKDVIELRKLLIRKEYSK